MQNFKTTVLEQPSASRAGSEALHDYWQIEQNQRASGQFDGNWKCPDCAV